MTDPLKLAEEIERDIARGSSPQVQDRDFPLLAAALRLAEAVDAQGEWVAALGAIRCLWCHGNRDDGHRANCALAAFRAAKETRR